MNQTTKTISLVLVSSALVFVGWGCPLAHENDQAHGTNASHAHYRAGHSWFWYSGFGRGGQFASARPGGTPTGNPGGVSSRGGFGSTGGAWGGSGIS